MIWKRSISSIIDDKNPVSTQFTRKMTQSIVQLRRKWKVSCFCNKCKGDLVESRTKIWYELDEPYSTNSANVLADELLTPLLVIYLQNELPESLQNPEIQKDVDESYWLNILNE